MMDVVVQGERGIGLDNLINIPIDLNAKKGLS